ncbi:MAG: DUF859 family phage minor structural protein [Eubacteriales bacterium]|nr:DUF859 family phage minor structural protein [Eubacteriales bacterium]
MAYQNLGTFDWGTGPHITGSVAYDYRRSGADMQYKVKVTIDPVYGTSYFGFPIYATIKLDSTTKVSAHKVKDISPDRWTSAIVYETDWLTVAGKTSGNTSLSVNLYCHYSDDYRDKTYSYSLYVVPAASNFVSVPIFTIGEAGSISLRRYVADYTDTVEVKIGTKSKTITDKRKLTTITWTPSGDDWYSVLSSVTSSVGSVTVTTYDASGNIVGSNTTQVALKVPSSIAPTNLALTLSPVNGNAWIAGKGIYVAGYSNVLARSAADPGTGSVMDSYGISGDAGTGSGAEWTSGVMTEGIKNIVMTAKDARGRTASITKQITVQTYTIPHISGLTYARGDCADGDWLDNDQGDDIKVSFELGLSLSDYGNVAHIDVSVDGVIKVSALNQDQGNKEIIIPDIGTDATVTIKVIVTDCVGRTGNMEMTVATVAVPVNVNLELPAVAFGKVAEKEHTLQCAWDMEVDGDLTVGGKTLLDLVYPVGAVYLSVNATDPSTLFGGTWERIKDTFLLAAGDTYAAGATGGEASVTLTSDNLASHTHGVGTYEVKGTAGDIMTDATQGGTSLNRSGAFTWSAAGRTRDYSGVAANGLRKLSLDAKSGAGFTGSSGATGGGVAHNNMPPYLAVYIWKRTA